MPKQKSQTKHQKTPPNQLKFNGSTGLVAVVSIIAYSLTLMATLVVIALFVVDRIAMPTTLGILIAQYPISLRFIFDSLLNYKLKHLQLIQGESHGNQQTEQTESD